ncbi:hypothetical protein GQ53DRAFT_758295 [Thozetella sp. PMI_491]|nr:hypothetical protein GQ53DRAFT_758295 [Thozetella sp. PMI_491]
MYAFLFFLFIEHYYTLGKILASLRRAVSRARQRRATPSSPPPPSPSPAEPTPLEPPSYLHSVLFDDSTTSPPPSYSSEAYSEEDRPLYLTDDSEAAVPPSSP